MEGVSAESEKSEPEKRRRRRRKPKEARAVVPTSTEESCGVEDSEPVDADAAVICAPPTEISAEQQPVAESRRRRRRRRRKRREERAEDEAESAASLVDGCDGDGDDDDDDDGDDGAGSGPIATVDPDGSVTFTVDPKSADFSADYGDLIQWLRDARAAAELPTAEEDLCMTFTIRISSHGGVPSTTSSATPDVTTAIAIDMATATTTDVDTATPGDITTAEVANETPVARKRRNRRRRRQAVRTEGGLEPVAEDAESHTADDTAADSHRQAEVGKDAALFCGGCFTGLFYSLARRFRRGNTLGGHPCILG